MNRPIFTVAVLTLLASCSSVSYNVDYDTAFDFSRLQTYGWAPTPEDAPGDPLTHRRIREAADRLLAAKGYTRSEDPDFRLAEHVGTEERVDVVDWGYGYGSRWRGGTRDVSVYNYTQGTVILDVVDTGSNELVWRGSATGVVSSNPTPEERIQKIDEVMAEMLAGFPPSTPHPHP